MDMSLTFQERFRSYPSIVMGIETALADLLNGENSNLSSRILPTEKEKSKLMDWYGWGARMKWRKE